MKTLKINSIKTLIIIPFIFLLFTNACTKSAKKIDTNTVQNSKKESVVAQPKIDIQTAIMTDNLEVVKQHVAAGTDINKKDQMSGATPLISAVTFGKTNIVKTLIDAKADLNIKNNDGATALHVAAFFCRVEIVQLLIDVKADKTAKNNFGATARESVLGSFTEVKPFYEMLQQQLGPLGLQIDLEEIEKTRPVIAMMLQ